MFVLLGFAVCVWGCFRYRETANFEGIWNLILCFFGMYLILRFGEAWYLVRWKNKKGHLGKLLFYHPFFHKSRTTVWYLFGVCVMQVCILSVFAVQMFSTRLVSDVDGLFPYDLVCLMNVEDEQDMAFAETVSEMSGVDASMYPMFRVSGTDATEQYEGTEQTKLRGQQIGIAESTYHALKKAADPGYEERKLQLDDRGEKIYIVHQQDKSTKGQPIDFKTNRKKPYLYTGPACENVDEFSHTTAFSRRTIAGEEISSLIGVFCQGERENLVVFSDVYFEKAKDTWETTNMYTGEILKSAGLKEAEQLTRQGPSALLLVHADEGTLKSLEPELNAFEERHAEDVKYDGRTKSYYLKTKGSATVQAELLMKRHMGQMIVATFLAACILLILIKMLTEHKAAAEKLEFLTCMGMKKKDRRKLIRFEMRIYYIIIMVLSLAVSSGITAATFHARMYTAADVRMMLKWMASFAAADMLLFGIVVLILTEIYIRWLER